MVLAAVNPSAGKGPRGDMTPLQKFGALCAGVLLGLVVLVVVVDLFRGTPPPAALVGALIPAFGGIMAGILAGARSSDKDKDKK